MPLDQGTRLAIRRAMMDAGTARKRRLKRPPAFIFNRGVEVRYERILTDIVDQWEQAYRLQVSPHLEGLIADSGIPRTDSWSDSLTSVMNGLRISFGDTWKPLPIQTQDIGQFTSEWNDKQWQKTIRHTLGVPVYQTEPWLNGQLESWTNRNVALVQKLSDEVAGQIDEIIQRGITAGDRVRTIEKAITGKVDLPAGVFRKARTRAKLIARDQINKLNGELTRNRQVNLGIKRYRWITSLDERVRPDHLSKHGKIFSWDNPPADTGHPGYDYQCRCYAEAVFDDILEDMGMEAPEFTGDRVPFHPLLTGPQGRPRVKGKKGSRRKRKTGTTARKKAPPPPAIPVPVPVAEFIPPRTLQEARKQLQDLINHDDYDQIVPGESWKFRRFRQVKSVLNANGTIKNGTVVWSNSLTLEAATEVNRKLTELMARSKAMGIPRIRVVRFSKATSFAARMGDGVLEISVPEANAALRRLDVAAEVAVREERIRRFNALLDPARLDLSRKYMSEAAMDEYIASQKAKIASVKKEIVEIKAGRHPDLFPRSQWKQGDPLHKRPFTTGSYFPKAQQIDAVMEHEYGHHVHRTLNVTNREQYFRPPIESRMRQDYQGGRFTASKYGGGEKARDVRAEWYAENHTLWNKGRRDLVDPNIKPLMEMVDKHATKGIQ